MGREFQALLPFFPTIGTQLRFFPAFIVQRRQIRTEVIGRIAKCLFAMWHQCIAKFANTLLSKLIKRTARLENRIASDRSGSFTEVVLRADRKSTRLNSSH